MIRLVTHISQDSILQAIQPGANNIEERSPVFEDVQNGVMRTSVSYNPGIGRYLLIVQQVNRFANKDFHTGIYESIGAVGPVADRPV